MLVPYYVVSLIWGLAGFLSSSLTARCVVNARCVQDSTPRCVRSRGPLWAAPDSAHGGRHQRRGPLGTLGAHGGCRQGQERRRG